MFSPSSSEDFIASIVQVTPSPSCTQSHPWFLCFAHWGPIWDKGELVRLTVLLVSQALWQQLVLLQLALPRQHLGILENRRQMCNPRITDMLLLPQLEKCQHVRSGNLPGFVLSLGKKGEKVKERKACAVPGLTQWINIFLLNYLKGEAPWGKEQLREETQLNCSVFSRAIGIQMIRPWYKCKADIHNIRCEVVGPHECLHRENFSSAFPAANTVAPEKAWWGLAGLCTMRAWSLLLVKSTWKFRP